MQNPRQYKIPDWFLNRNRDIKDGKTAQVEKCNNEDVTLSRIYVTVRPYNGLKLMVKNALFLFIENVSN